MKLFVLMSTYNGEQYIRQQLDSLLDQELLPTRIYIRDDGSKDKTVEILEEYASENNIIEYYCGKNIGPAKSFFELINKYGGANYYALCDQDDVWFKDKLKVAIDSLKKEDNDIPLLYCSKYTLTDGMLNPINSDVSKLYSYSDFPHSLIYHTAPGCTFVFNEAAREKIIKFDYENEYMLIHDAIIHKVVTMFGKMILDDGSHMYYRQHGNNEIGMSSNKFNVFVGRVTRFLNGKIRNYRSKSAQSLLNIYGDECSKQNRELLEIVAYYKNNKELKNKLIELECFKTNTINDVFFRFLVLVNYI